MSEVWTSDIRSNPAVGDKPGMITKFFDEEWPAPLVRHVQPRNSKVVMRAMSKAGSGEVLARHEFPEAASVYDPKLFKRMRDFFWVKGFAAVKGEHAKVLAEFDLGDGGLVPFTIYEEDKQTPIPGPFYLLNLGPPKRCFVPEKSNKITPFLTMERHGREVWEAVPDRKDGDIAVTSSALEGSDIWFDERLWKGGDYVFERTACRRTASG